MRAGAAGVDAQERSKQREARRAARRTADPSGGLRESSLSEVSNSGLELGGAEPPGSSRKARAAELRQSRERLATAP